MHTQRKELTHLHTKQLSAGESDGPGLYLQVPHASPEHELGAVGPRIMVRAMRYGEWVKTTVTLRSVAINWQNDLRHKADFIDAEIFAYTDQNELVVGYVMRNSIDWLVKRWVFED